MDILLVDFLGKPVWSWIGFLVLVLALLVFDLGVLQRKSHEIGIRESLMLSAFHISIGLAIQTIMAASSGGCVKTRLIVVPTRAFGVRVHF